MILFFFFSSRRRHTRLQGDWSSDVCSSDLWKLRNGDAHLSDFPVARGKEPSQHRLVIVQNRKENGGLPESRYVLRTLPYTNEPPKRDLPRPEVAGAIDMRLCEFPEEPDQRAQQYQ